MKKLLYSFILLLLTISLHAETFKSGTIEMKLPKGFKIDKNQAGNFQGTFTGIDVFEEETKQYWDTANNTWVNYGRETTTVDTVAGTITLIELDSLQGQLVLSIKYIIYAEFDMVQGAFTIDSTAMFQWTGADWSLFAITNYTYDGNSYLTGILTSYQIMPGMLTPVSRTTYTNNTAGNPVTMLSESYSFGTSTWENDQKTELSYLTGNLNYVTVEDDFTWEDNAWVQSEKTTYVRNTQLNPTEIIYYCYDGGISENCNREIFVYNADGIHIDSAYTYGWGFSSGGWEPASLTVFVYNTAWDEDVITHKTWTGAAWENERRTSFMYDGNEREIEELTETWQGPGFLNAYRDLTVYDITGVEDTYIAANFKLNSNYPNPFNPSTTISYELQNAAMVILTVYNMLGQQVAVLQSGYQQAGTHVVKFDGTGLTSGVYLYELTIGNVKLTKKMILNK